MAALSNSAIGANPFAFRPSHCCMASGSKGSTSNLQQPGCRPGTTSTAPLSLSASLHHHLSTLQQAEAAHFPAETKQPAPAQHSMLHRGASSEHRQARASQQTVLSGLLADPAVAANREWAASDAALQTRTAAATAQEGVRQPPLPQQWSASTHDQKQMSPELAYTAFVLHMNKHHALPLDEAIALVFPPDALEHQLDQQFMEHARSRCLLLLKAATPHTAVPYSQSSETPNTWRAAVLYLFDWLVEVHRQGVLADDHHAKQHRRMLFHTLRKVQVSLAADPFHLAVSNVLCCRMGSMQLVSAHDCCKPLHALQRHQYSRINNKACRRV